MFVLLLFPGLFATLPVSFVDELSKFSCLVEELFESCSGP